MVTSQTWRSTLDLWLTAGQVLGPGAATLAAHGEQARADLRRCVDAELAVVVRRVVDTLLDDLTALVRENVDLVGLAVEVVDTIDLPEIIRESTGTMAGIVNDREECDGPKRSCSVQPCQHGENRL